MNSQLFFSRITWSKIRVRIIHGRVLYTGKYGTLNVHVELEENLLAI